MGDYKETSRVEMSLKDYLEITEKAQKHKEQTDMLKAELFKGFEKGNNNKMVFERYNLSSQKIHNLIKEIYPEDYKILEKSFEFNSEDEDD